MSESPVAMIHFRKAQYPVPEPTLLRPAFLGEGDPAEDGSRSGPGEAFLKRVDSGFFEGIYQAEEKAESLTCIKDDNSDNPRSSTPKPQIDNFIVPQPVRRAIQQDLRHPRALLRSVRHGYLHADVCYDERIAALCSHAAGSSQNIEVLKYTRVFSRDGTEDATFKISQLYGRGAYVVHPRLHRWAAKRAAISRHQARTNVAKMKEKQCQVEGGLLASLRKRINRPAGTPRILHCRVNKPARPEKTLHSSYMDAFRAWDAAMSESIPGYAQNYEKRHWYISQWDGPIAK